jgi:hypothetical protein
MATVLPNPVRIPARATSADPAVEFNTQQQLLLGQAYLANYTAYQQEQQRLQHLVHQTQRQAYQTQDADDDDNDTDHNGRQAPATSTSANNRAKKAGHKRNASSKPFKLKDVSAGASGRQAWQATVPLLPQPPRKDNRGGHRHHRTNKRRRKTKEPKLPPQPLPDPQHEVQDPAQLLAHAHDRLATDCPAKLPHELPPHETDEWGNAISRTRLVGPSHDAPVLSGPASPILLPQQMALVQDPPPATKSPLDEPIQLLDHEASMWAACYLDDALNMSIPNVILCLELQAKAHRAELREYFVLKQHVRTPAGLRVRILAFITLSRPVRLKEYLHKSEKRHGQVTRRCDLLDIGDLRCDWKDIPLLLTGATNAGYVPASQVDQLSPDTTITSTKDAGASVANSPAQAVEGSPALSPLTTTNTTTSASHQGFTPLSEALAKFASKYMTTTTAPPPPGLGSSQPAMPSDAAIASYQARQNRLAQRYAKQKCHHTDGRPSLDPASPQAVATTMMTSTPNLISPSYPHSRKHRWMGKYTPLKDPSQRDLWLYLILRPYYNPDTSKWRNNRPEFKRGVHYESDISDKCLLGRVRAAHYMATRYSLVDAQDQYDAAKTERKQTKAAAHGQLEGNKPGSRNYFESIATAPEDGDNPFLPAFMGNIADMEMSLAMPYLTKLLFDRHHQNVGTHRTYCGTAQCVHLRHSHLKLVEAIGCHELLTAAVIRNAPADLDYAAMLQGFSPANCVARAKGRIAASRSDSIYPTYKAKGCSPDQPGTSSPPQLSQSLSQEEFAQPAAAKKKPRVRRMGLGEQNRHNFRQTRLSLPDLASPTSQPPLVPPTDTTPNLAPQSPLLVEASPWEEPSSEPSGSSPAQVEPTQPDVPIILASQPAEPLATNSVPHGPTGQPPSQQQVQDILARLAPGLEPKARTLGDLLTETPFYSANPVTVQKEPPPDDHQQQDGSSASPEAGHCRKGSRPSPLSISQALDLNLACQAVATHMDQRAKIATQAAARKAQALDQAARLQRRQATRARASFLARRQPSCQPSDPNLPSNQDQDSDSASSDGSNSEAEEEGPEGLLLRDQLRSIQHALDQAQELEDSDQTPATDGPPSHTTTYGECDAMLHSVGQAQQRPSSTAITPAQQAAAVIDEATSETGNAHRPPESLWHFSDEPGPQATSANGHGPDDEPALYECAPHPTAMLQGLMHLGHDPLLTGEAQMEDLDFSSLLSPPPNDHPPQPQGDKTVPSSYGRRQAEPDYADQEAACYFDRHYQDMPACLPRLSHKDTTITNAMRFESDEREAPRRKHPRVRKKPKAYDGKPVQACDCTVTIAREICVSRPGNMSFCRPDAAWARAWGPQWDPHTVAPTEPTPSQLARARATADSIRALADNPTLHQAMLACAMPLQRSLSSSAGSLSSSKVPMTLGIAIADDQADMASCCDALLKHLQEHPDIVYLSVIVGNPGHVLGSAMADRYNYLLDRIDMSKAFAPKPPTLAARAHLLNRALVSHSDQILVLCCDPHQRREPSDNYHQVTDNAAGSYLRKRARGGRPQDKARLWKAKTKLATCGNYYRAANDPRDDPGDSILNLILQTRQAAKPVWLVQVPTAQQVTRHLEAKRQQEADQIRSIQALHHSGQILPPEPWSTPMLLAQRTSEATPNMMGMGYQAGPNTGPNLPVATHSAGYDYTSCIPYSLADNEAQPTYGQLAQSLESGGLESEATTPQSHGQTLAAATPPDDHTGYSQDASEDFSPEEGYSYDEDPDAAAQEDADDPEYVDHPAIDG